MMQGLSKSRIKSSPASVQLLLLNTTDIPTIPHWTVPYHPNSYTKLKFSMISLIRSIMMTSSTVYSTVYIVFPVSLNNPYGHGKGQNMINFKLMSIQFWSTITWIRILLHVVITHCHSHCYICKTKFNMYYVSNIGTFLNGVWFLSINILYWNIHFCSALHYSQLLFRTE
jgi:hypothetical protein